MKSSKRRIATALALTPLAALTGLAVSVTGAQAAETTVSPTVAYVLEAYDHQVVSVHADGTVSTFVSGLNAPQDISVDPVTGTLYVVDKRVAGGGSTITTYRSDGVTTGWSEIFQYVVPAIAAYNGTLYISRGDDVFAEGTAAKDSFGIPDAMDLAVTGDGTLYAARGTDVNGLVKVTPDGTKSYVDVDTTPTLTRISYPKALATTPGSRDVWVSDANRSISPYAGRVVQLSGTTPANLYPGSQTEIAPVIGVSPDGSLMSWDGIHARLVSTSPTGTQTVVATGISQPAAIAVAPSLIAGRAALQVSSSIENEDWSKVNLTNGSLFSWDFDRGYSSASSVANTVAQSVTYDLGSRRSITSAVLYPRTQVPNEPIGMSGAGFPADLRFDVSDDGATWKTAAAFTGQSADDGHPRTYVLPPGTNGQYLRVAVTKLGRPASDDTGYRFQLAELKVYGSMPTPINGTAPGATLNTPYSYSYANAKDPATTFRIASGGLPGGLSLSSTGTITGTPAATGPSTFTVAARNSYGLSTKAQTITVTAPAALTGTPPSGSVSSTYSWSFGVSGYPAPKVAVTSGALPAGLSLNSDTGAITGMPTRAGQTTFQVTATSTAADTATRTVTMTINPGASGQLANAAPPASVQPGAWESNDSARIFAEKQNLVLTDSITVGGNAIAPGTKVNVYYVHADAVGSANVLTRYYGAVQFGERVLGVATTATDLQATAGLLGNPGTTYATTPDQGLESPDAMTIWSSQDTITLDLSVYSGSDAVRIITLAP
ncbi:MAG TPA: putative Ig domain-containing protein [Mycobacteriales bacterium]|nr:putative Ig domain-containing protein [Mycobacteriales bacterium]